MKKKSFGLAAAVAVLIVLGGSYTLLANHNRIQESESAAAESETGVAVATIASDKVSSFQLADGDTSFTLTKTDNSWICVQDETFPLSNDAASELVNTFTSLQAVRDLGTAQDGENYGFSENAPTVTLTSSDSTNCSFVLGEANSMTGDYYLKREDSGEIYTVSSSLADSFHKTLTDLAEIESFPTISSDNVQELSITKEGTTLLFESSTTGSVKTWQISQSQDGGKTESTPEKATVNTVTTLVDHLGNLSFDSFVDHKEENKEKAFELYNKLQENGIQTIIDDRENLNMGNRINDVYALGTPNMIVMGKKFEDGKYELENSKTGEKEVYTIEELIKRLVK